jgi:hypothetical protein
MACSSTRRRLVFEGRRLLENLRILKLIYQQTISLFPEQSTLDCQDVEASSCEDMSNVLFICKTKSRLRRRHCGLARHFKTDPTETVAFCFGYAKTLQLTMKALWPGASFQNRSY